MSSNTSGAAVAAENKLTAAELEHARIYLEQSQTCVVGAIKGLSADQWKFSPAPACWSISENADHILAVNNLVLGMVRNNLPQAPAPAEGRDSALIDAIVIGRFPHRFGRFNAPEALKPTGCFATPAEAIDALGKSYADLLDAFGGSGLRDHVLPAPPLKAVTQGAHELMDGYQWLLAAAAHAERHSKQILEVRANPNFPAV